MRTEFHISVVNAEVGTGMLPRHAARRYDRGRAFVVATGLGFPRLWGYAMNAAMEGFRAQYEVATEKGPDRLEAALRGARERLAKRCDVLVEKSLPDAALTGLFMSEGMMHVLHVGQGRVYLHRKGESTRLTRRNSEDTGLLQGEPTGCAIEVEPDDLVLAGSASAFSSSAIARVSSVLADDRGAPPSVLASVLTEPAAKTGTGAAAIVLRVL